MWCWRPELKAPTPIHEDNYRCCYECCTSVVGFRLVIYTGLALVLLNAPLALLATIFGLSNYIFYWIGLLILSIFVSLGLLAIRFRRPIIMQLYLVLFSITALVELILLSVVFCVAASVVLANSTHGEELIHKLYDHTSLIRASDVSTLLLFAAPIGIGGLIWKLLLTHSYYSYLRDHQLALEQEKALPEMDREKQENGTLLNASLNGSLNGIEAPI